jgi:hypothetical protein
MFELEIRSGQSYLSDARVMTFICLQWGRTPLHIACEKAHMRAGTMINCKSHYSGILASMNSLQGGYVEVVSLLLSAGAVVEARDQVSAVRNDESMSVA